MIGLLILCVLSNVIWWTFTKCSNLVQFVSISLQLLFKFQLLAPDICETYWSLVSPSSQKAIIPFPFCFNLTNSFEMAFPVLNGFFWEPHAGVCTVTVMVIRLLFHLESNIMMTLKLDMKHICKKDMRRGTIWARVGSLGGRRGSLHQRRWDGRVLRAFLRKESRYRDQSAPRWLAWFCCRSPLVSHLVQ